MSSSQSLFDEPSSPDEVYEPAELVLQVSEAHSLINQSLQGAFPQIIVEGEVSQYRVSKGKWIYFDLKDDNATINCFATVYQLRAVIEEGMKVRVYGQPNLTKWGRFSLTVRSLQPVGEGSLKKAFELTKKKLAAEGLFAEERKRALPQMPERVAIVSSMQAAGYGDFIKIAEQRWGGVQFNVADVQVQGEPAPAMIARAIAHINQLAELPEVIVVVRGGGSADDLAAFNTETVVRAIVGSRVPVLVGVGHEIDTTLADLAADMRAATPSNAAEILLPDASQVLGVADMQVLSIHAKLTAQLSRSGERLAHSLQRMKHGLLAPMNHLESLTERLKLYDPRAVLKKGYSLVQSPGGEVIRSKKQLKKGDVVRLRFEADQIDATIR